MSMEDKMAEIVKNRLSVTSVCTECRLYSKSNGYKLVVLKTEQDEFPQKYKKNVRVLRDIEDDLIVGNRVLVVFLDGDIEKPVIIGRLR